MPRRALRAVEEPALDGVRPCDEVAASLGGVDLRLLRYFVAVADDLHFSDAAQRLNIAQPALSSSIKVLELRLGMKLLARTTRRVQLTPAGVLLLGSARHLLDAHATLLSEMAAQRRAEAGRMRLGYAGGFTGTLPAAAARACAGRGASGVQLCDIGACGRFAALHAQDVDAVLLTSPLPEETGISSVLVGHTERVLALSATHRVALAGPAPLDGWGGEHIAVAGETPRWSEFWSPACFYLREPAEAASTLEAALELVAAGGGATMAPAIAVGRCDRADITYLPVTGQSPVGVHLAWRSDDRPAMLDAVLPVLAVALEGSAEGHAAETTGRLALLVDGSD